MGVMDEKLLFGESIDIGSVSASSVVIATNTLNLGQLTDYLGATIGNDIGESGRLDLVCQVEDEALKLALAGVLTMRLYTKASASSMASGTLLASKAVSVAASSSSATPDGTVLWRTPLPKGDYLQYLTVAFHSTQAGGTGKITAYLTEKSERLS